MAARDPHRRGDASTPMREARLKVEVARMRVDFARMGKTADHLTDREILDGIVKAGEQGSGSDRPGKVPFAEARQAFAKGLPDAPESE